MNTRFSILEAGWATLPPSQTSKALKAMAKYKKAHPLCEVTGSNKSVQVHHIIPVWKAPELSAEPSNMISLSTSANIHMLFGHGGNFQSKYVLNIREVADKMLALRDTFDIVYRSSDEVTIESVEEETPCWLRNLFSWIRSKWFDI